MSGSRTDVTMIIVVKNERNGSGELSWMTAGDRGGERFLRDNPALVSASDPAQALA